MAAFLVAAGCGRSSEPTSRPSSEPSRQKVVPTQAVETKKAASAGVPAFAEVTLAQDLTRGRYYPDPLVLAKGEKVLLFAASNHLEHVNRWQIGPFVNESERIPAGRVVAIEFTPSRAGRYRIRNIGHGWESALVVAPSCRAAETLLVREGVQRVALAHSVEAGRTYPRRIVVRLGLRLRVANLVLDGDISLSIGRFVSARPIRAGEFQVVEFTANRVGAFPIRSRGRDVGQLVVRASLC